MKLKDKVKYHREMQDYFRDEANLYKEYYEKYKDLFNTSIHQTKLSNMQKEHLLSIIDEVEVLLEKYSSMTKDNRERSNYEMLLAIIENWKNRHHLDIILSNREVAEWQYNFSSIEEKVDKITEEIMEEFEEDEIESEPSDDVETKLPKDLKEKLIHKWKLVLYDFDLAKLVDIINWWDDYYYRFLLENWDIEDVSCCVWFTPLYWQLSDDEYNRLDALRDLNVENEE